MRLDEIEQRLGDIVHEFRRGGAGQAVRDICGSHCCGTRDGFSARRYDRPRAYPPREEPGLGYAETLGGTRYVFSDLKTLLARATPPRSGDRLAGVAAADMTERVAAQRALADLRLRPLIEDPVVPYEADEITRLIIDTHNPDAFAPIAAMTVGELRDWLLSDAADTAALTRLAAGLTPEIVAAVSKIMRLQDLVSVAAKCRVVTRF